MQFTIDKINKEFKNKLNNVYSNAEIQQILFLVYESILSLTKIKVLTNSDKLVSEKDVVNIMLIKDRLLANEPIQYILGETEFFDLYFKVDSSVLVPRPETEELVQWIIDSCSNTSIRVLDAGTGSGCIAITLAKKLLGSTVYAIDISKKALAIAESNSLLNSTPISFCEYDIINGQRSSLPDNLDILVSNPPYIRDSERVLMKQNVLDYEPNIALFVSDNDPLVFYKEIASIGRDKLREQGILFFEINEALGDEVMIMLEDMNYSNIEIRKDINGKDRMVKAIL